MLERELKLAVDGHSAVRARLQELAVPSQGTRHQVDSYYRHPGRDLAQTDEALRIRQTGDAYELTYKGPREGGPVKTRHELNSAADARTALILQALGFTFAAKVEKQRETFFFMGAEVALDSVTGLGTFVEIEAREEACDLQAAAQALGLRMDHALTESYLELLQGPAD